MNERIKELERRATSHMSGRPPYDGLTFDVFDKEKFAELIVAECTRIVINNGVATATHDQMVRQDCVNEIKQHFGVEE
jgi:hypothetical protein